MLDVFGMLRIYFVKPNVKSIKVGYIGGSLSNPTYEEVYTDQTGHAEDVEIEFDPDEISYEDLLDVFWNNPNPTTTFYKAEECHQKYFKKQRF